LSEGVGEAERTVYDEEREEEDGEGDAFPDWGL